MPSLYHPLIHQGMTPLPESIGEEVIGCPDDLPKETSFVQMRHKFSRNNAINSHRFIFQS
jgi:hypothetical protein